MMRTFVSAMGLAIMAAGALAGDHIQFDFPLGYPGYAGALSPAHVASPQNVGGEGYIPAAQTNWNVVLSDTSSGLVFADGSSAVGVAIDFGQGFATDGSYGGDNNPDTITWSAHFPNIFSYDGHSSGVLDTALMEDCVYWTGAGADRIGIRVSGLPAGTYRVYVLSVAPNGPNRTYTIEVGGNLNTYTPANATTIGPAGYNDASWVANRQYLVKEVTIGAGDYITVIEGGSSGTRALSGLQIAFVPPPAGTVVTVR
jgi:hypothetical protein